MGDLLDLLRAEALPIEAANLVDNAWECTGGTVRRVVHRLRKGDTDQIGHLRVPRLTACQLVVKSLVIVAPERDRGREASAPSSLLRTCAQTRRITSVY